MMSIIVISSDAERIHMALMMAASASAMGKKVAMFFSKGGVKAVTKGGWQELTASCGTSANDMDKNLEAVGVADFDILVDALSALDIKFYVCDSAMAEHGLDILDLISRPQVKVTGLASLIEYGSGGDWLTF